MRYIASVEVNSADRRNEIYDWCNETFGYRKHFSEPSENQPWMVRIGQQRDIYDFSFRSESESMLFILRWK